MHYQTMDELQIALASCQQCPLGATRQSLVFGVGCPTAEVLFVGEGPGRNEDEQGEPFVGRSGQLLDTMLATIGLSRKENIYIANIVKCRPPENRDPSPTERDACMGFLQNQIAILQPKIIVCLGRIPAQSLIGAHFKVTQQHGQFIQGDKSLLMGTFHPAALLRNPHNKPLATEDFLALREKIQEICCHTYPIQV